MDGICFKIIAVPYTMKANMSKRQLYHVVDFARNYKTFAKYWEEEVGRVSLTGNKPCFARNKEMGELNG